LLRPALSAFVQQVETLSQSFTAGGLTPPQFRTAMAGLRGALQMLGRETVRALLLQAEESSDTLERDGTVWRCKGVSAKQWCTPWGTLTVPRRLYQADRGGPSYVPLDHRCGMVDRFMTPEVERLCCLLGAQLVPAAVEQAVAEALGTGPSRTAIQHLLHRVGQCAETHAGELEAAIQAQHPLPTQGDTLVVGWDGTMVPLRQPSAEVAAPEAAEDADADAAQDPTAWKEAGVGMVAVYDLPWDPVEAAAERLDVRYFARMPEPKMPTLIGAVATQTARALEASCFAHCVFLGDGKRDIWRAVAAQPVFADFTQVLDFCHAAAHLSTAAEAIFGPGTAAAQRYFVRWRHDLRHEPGAVEDLLRSLRRYARLRRRRARGKDLRRELAYFVRNRQRMDYARLAAQGLPIGSGPIEAACKTVVGQRLKGTGMRWDPQRAQEILNLRLPLCSGRWDAFWSWYLDHTDDLAQAA